MNPIQQRQKEVQNQSAYVGRIRKSLEENDS